MKKIKKIIAAIALCAIAASAMGCKMIEKTPEAIQNTVLATVGNEKITKGDLDKQIGPQLKQQFGDDYETNDKVKDQVKQAKKQGLDSLVTQKVLLQEATILNLKPSDDDLNKKVDDQINQYKTQYPEEGQFESVLQQNGLTEDQLRSMLKDQLVMQAVQDNILKDVAVTDDEVQTYYNENKDSKYTQGAGATASHILIAEKASDGTTVDFDASLKKANDIKSKLDAGADFATLAKENSADPGSKDKGGSLGFVAYNSTDLVPEFMNGFKNLKEGEISAPVKSQYGYHIIKATGLKDSQVTPFEQVKDQIKSTLLQQKQGDTFNSKITEWKNDLKVKTYEDKL
ncbi:MULTISPECIES: peptidylprolyl isomerase [unclassified Clostridium]|uniref:peptidylprolyl isomerase n=1 Tax=unclassified Clostridium TaxID=2614128 RepID=UPI000297F0B4|nr:MULTISPECIES: peptidylprolyl isomerase [unclassified Clostridium]EKQ55980.1 MAG: parvulin-like peptidyl-prolyl isomerase [Clostridium sp. Maddingley MBC34-26]